MMILRPFQALRPDPKRVRDLAAVPYDVVNREEARQLCQGNPWSFLHVSRAEIDLEDRVDVHSQQVYEHALMNFRNLREKCPLILEQEPSLYLYQLRMGNHEQTGIAGSFSIDAYQSDKIKKHEKTRPDKEDDRTRHILQLSAQTGPVFLAYRNSEVLQQEISQVKKQNSLYDFTAADGVQHTVWKIANASALAEKFNQNVIALYIADGHHRAAAASRARTELAKKNPHHTGKENYNFMLAVAFPDQELMIMPYHRVVKDLNGLTQSQFLEKLSAAFQIEAESNPAPRAGEFGMYLNSHWYRLKPKRPVQQAELDVSILQDQVLEPLLGISDPRTSQKIAFVGGIRGAGELKRLVDSGEYQVAFLMYPTRMQQVMEVSDRGEIMPPKSTWFEPKLRDGIFTHLI